MQDESVDFDDIFPDFDPASFDDHYPAPSDYPPPYWEVAMRRVYDHELYQMARDPEYAAEMRTLARRAWGAIEHNSVDDLACSLTGHLLDCASNRTNDGSLIPLKVSVYLSVILWVLFREPGASPWLQYILHDAIEQIDIDDRALSAEQAFLAGFAAGLVDGELGGNRGQICRRV